MLQHYKTGCGNFYIIFFIYRGTLPHMQFIATINSYRRELINSGASRCSDFYYDLVRVQKLRKLDNYLHFVAELSHRNITAGVSVAVAVHVCG